MKFSLITSFALATASLVAAAPKVPYFAGFNMGANKPDGLCKNQADWEADFRKIKSWSPNAKAQFTNVKLFSTNDCNTLQYAVPAALATNTRIWAGLWPADYAKFSIEKKALEDAIKKHGTGWLLGINVGSEALYRKEIDPNVLAGYIYDVKGMVQVAYKATNVAVGCADTWTAWVNGVNKPVIDASDVILMNGFPYWQGVDIKDALTTFRQSIWNTRKSIGPVKQIIIGETGWPTAGPTQGASAIASLQNLQQYYTAASCWLQSSGLYSWFWFSAFDEPQRFTTVERNFGVSTSNKVPKIKFNCPA